MNIRIWKLMEKDHIVNNLLEIGGRMRKTQFHVWQIFCRLFFILMQLQPILWGKNSLHPIYISLGNIPTWRRNKEDAKQLLGYLPIVFAKDASEKKTPHFKKLVRETFHNSIKFLLDPLFKKDGIDLNINDEKIWFYPRISTIICDWPEACTFSLTYKSPNSNFPCHFCLVSKNDLASVNLRDKELRNHKNMINYYNSNTTNLASLEPVYNYFWDIP